jgi:hypothetical protein
LGEQEKRAKTPRKEDLDSHEKRARDPNNKEKGKDPDHILKKEKEEGLRQDVYTTSFQVHQLVFTQPKDWPPNSKL